MGDNKKQKRRKLHITGASDWIRETVVAAQKKKADKVLLKAKQQEIDKVAPAGKKLKWVRTGIRAMKQILVDK